MTKMSEWIAWVQCPRCQSGMLVDPARPDEPFDIWIEEDGVTETVEPHAAHCGEVVP